MIKAPIVFITGAGASVDSGLRTYRGNDGIYNNSPNNPQNDLSIETWNETPFQTWNTLGPLIKSIKQNNPGPTYQLLKSINEKHEIQIITQNIDGYAHFSTDNVRELHGNIKSMQCIKCSDIYELNENDPACYKCMCVCKPNIVLYGESARGDKINYKWPNTVIIIGTTLQFPYLKRMIKKYKQHGASIIHINPDEEYGSIIGKHEIWMRMKSEQALNTLF